MRVITHQVLYNIKNILKIKTNTSNKKSNANVYQKDTDLKNEFDHEIRLNFIGIQDFLTFGIFYLNAHQLCTCLTL